MMKGGLLVGAAAFAAVALAEPGARPDRFPPVRINHDITHYTVQGDSIERIREQLRRRAPQDMASGHGRTSSRFEVAAEIEQDGDGCALAGLELSVDIRTTLPAWEESPRAGVGVRQQWLVALSQLTRHEDGHRRNAVEAAHELHATLVALPPVDDCIRMQANVDTQVRRATWRLRTRDRLYDERTQGGLREDDVPGG